MRALRWLGAWLSDWRTGVTFLASIVTGLVVAIVIVAGINTHDAINARNLTAQAAARQIDKLNGRISDLVDQAQVNGARIGELTGQIEALSEQVRQLGGKPVATTITTTPGASPTTAPPSTTTTTTPRSTPTTQPTTTTTTPRRCVLIVCQ